MSTSSTFGSNPLGYTGISFNQNPPFINAGRAPTANDINLPGTQWQDNSVTPPVIYETVGNGVWGVGGDIPHASTTTYGTGTLASGTVTISNTNIATGDLIFIQRIATNGTTTFGVLTYTISNATSFTVTSLILGTPASTQTADTSTFAYFIVRPL